MRDVRPVRQLTPVEALTHQARNRLPVCPSGGRSRRIAPTWGQLMDERGVAIKNSKDYRGLW